jgi:hypothetical protein
MKRRAACPLPVSAVSPGGPSFGVTKITGIRAGLGDNGIRCERHIEANQGNTSMRKLIIMRWSQRSFASECCSIPQTVHRSEMP